MNKFETLAKQSFGTCSLMENREKISTNAIIADNPDGITIDGFDMIVNTDSKTGEVIKYCIITYKESPEYYYLGGQALTQVVETWIESYKGDLELANKELQECGGCKLKLENVRTKRGNNYVKISM